MLLSCLNRDVVGAGILGIFLWLGPVLALFAGDPEEETDVEYAIRAPLVTRSLILDAFSIEGRTVVVGERGHILISENEGRTWVQAIVPTRTTLNGIYFLNRSLGWAVGHDAVILRTVDGGWSWERVHNAPEDEIPLFDVWFKNQDQGFALGAYGYFVKTTNGGQTWSRSEFKVLTHTSAQHNGPQNSSPEDGTVSMGEDYSESYDFHLNRISEAHDGRLYVAAEAGNLYRSDDGGKTWIALPSPYHGSFFGVLALEGNVLLAYGLRGHLFRSEDLGETWQPLETSTREMLTDGLRLQDGKTIIVGLGGMVLISRDNLSFIPRPQPHRTGFSAIVQTDKGNVIVVGESGVKILPPSVYTLEPQLQDRSR